MDDDVYCCQVWDLRKNDMLYRMHGHADTVTGTELSPDGSYLLTTAMDNTGEFLFWLFPLITSNSWVVRAVMCVYLFICQQVDIS